MNQKEIKEILNKIIKNNKCKGKSISKFKCEQKNFDKMFLIASVISKYKNACWIDNIKDKTILETLKTKFNLYIYKYKKNSLIISNTEINKISKITTFELGKLFSYLTPIDLNEPIQQSDLSCSIEIKYKNINDLTNKIYTSKFMYQRIIGKSKIDIHKYLNKYIKAINDIKKYIKDDYKIISVEKIIKTKEQIKEHNRLLSLKKINTIENK